MSNRFKTLALLPVLAFTLTACTLQDLPVIGQYFGSTSTEPVTLNVWGLWEDPQVMQTLAAKYQEQHPNVTINYEDRSIMKTVDYKERVFTRLDGSSELDVVLVHNSWIPRLSSKLSTLPSSIMDVPTYTQTFYPVATESAVLNDQIYAFPAYYDGLVLVYNKEHFNEVGQRFPPTAWEEFRRLASDLTIRTGDDQEILTRAGAAIGTADNIDHFADILGLMWSQTGLTIPDDIDKKPGYETLAYYTNFALEDQIWDENMREATSAFIAGEVSMIFVPAWQLLDIAQNVEDPGFIGVAPVPQINESEPKAWGSFWMYAVPLNSTKSATAWDFVNFLGQKEQQLTYFDEASKVRLFGPLYSSVELSGQITSSLLSPFLTTAPFAKSAEIAARSGNNRQVTALRDAVNGVLSGVLPQEVMIVAKETIDK